MTNIRTRLGALLLVPAIVLGLGAAALAANNTNLTLTISDGTLSVDIVDGAGTTVATPSVAMSAVTAGFAIQNSTGTLGTASEKIRLSNPTSTPAWSVTIAATSGATATWTASGGKTMDFNAAASSTGALTVDPSVGSVAAILGGVTTGVSLGSSTAFSQGVTDSITLYSADGTAAVFEQYDLTGVSLSQEVPSGQAGGAYIINLTLTAA